MAETPAMKFRLEPEYKKALEKLGRVLRRKKLIRHPTSTGALRYLIEEASKANLGYSVYQKVDERLDKEIPPDLEDLLDEQERLREDRIRAKYGIPNRPSPRPRQRTE